MTFATRLPVFALLVGFLMAGSARAADDRVTGIDLRTDGAPWGYTYHLSIDADGKVQATKGPVRGAPTESVSATVMLSADELRQIFQLAAEATAEPNPPETCTRPRFDAVHATYTVLLGDRRVTIACPYANEWLGRGPVARLRAIVDPRLPDAITGTRTGPSPFDALR